MYAKLVFRNAKRSVKDYLVYIVTMTICVTLFYAFLSISSSYYSPDIGSEYDFTLLSDGMKIAICMITLLLLFLIRFVNHYMLRRKQKEFAVQSIMGMEQKTIGRIFFAETLIMGMFSILIGIFATWILGMICEAIGLYVPDGKDFYSLYPTFRMIDLGALGTTFGQCFNVDFSGVNILNFITVLFAFLFVDIFDTLGTLIGVSTKANMLDEEGKLPRIRPALLADAIATSVGAIFGTSTTTTYVESSAGVAAGGRTGLSAMVTGLLFLLAIVFAPIFTAIPSFATAPALIFVGFLMISSIISIDFEDITEAVPAYLAMLAMPLMYSISEGIALGVISYVVINLCCGKAKKIKPLMYILAVLFVLKYIFL